MYHTSTDILDSVLADIRHLDLTERTEIERSGLQASGGYCDVFFGRSHVPQRGPLKVAIKRLRCPIRSEDDYAKVRVVILVCRSTERAY